MIATEMAPHVGTCPAGSGHEPCDIRGWIYRTESVNPRMYAKCWACGGWTIVLLPKQEAYAPTPPDDDDELVVDAVENALRDPSIARRIVSIFIGDPHYLSASIMESIERRIRTEFKSHIDQLLRARHDPGNDLDWDVQRGVEEKVGKLERRLNHIMSKMDDLVAHSREKIRAAILQERRRLTPKPPRGDILCDARHALPTIYGLIAHAEPDRVRYVGQSMNAGSRYGGHCSDGAAPRVKQWIKGLPERPLMILLENCHAVELDDREHYWIQHYRQQGMADLNTNIRAATVVEL